MQAFSEYAIVKVCMKQGGFKTIGEYIKRDKTLSNFMSKKSIDDLDRTVKSEEKSFQRTYSDYQM